MVIIPKLSRARIVALAESVRRRLQKEDKDAAQTQQMKIEAQLLQEGKILGLSLGNDDDEDGGDGGGGGPVTKKADLLKHWEQKEKAKQQRLLEERHAKEALEQQQVLVHPNHSALANPPTRYDHAARAGAPPASSESPEHEGAQEAAEAAAQRATAAALRRAQEEHAASAPAAEDLSHHFLPQVGPSDVNTLSGACLNYSMWVRRSSGQGDNGVDDEEEDEFAHSIEPVRLRASAVDSDDATTGASSSSYCCPRHNHQVRSAREKLVQRRRLQHLLQLQEDIQVAAQQQQEADAVAALGLVSTGGERVHHARRSHLPTVVMEVHHFHV